MGSPDARPVRIARRRTPVTSVPYAPTPRERRAAARARELADFETRINRGATRRAIRVSILYEVAIGAMYTVYYVLTEFSLEGASGRMQYQLDVLGGFAVVLAVLGPVLTFASAPTAFEVSPRYTLVRGRFRRLREFPPLDGVMVRRVRRFPVSFYSPEPVDLVELRAGDESARYFVEEGLLPITEEGPRSHPH
jgi:hypothetical protein